MLIGQDSEEEEEEREVPAADVEEENVLVPASEEAVVSMFALSSNPNLSTMKFKGKIGTKPICALIDSGTTHSFIDPELNVKFPKLPLRRL